MMCILVLFLSSIPRHFSSSNHLGVLEQSDEYNSKLPYHHFIHIHDSRSLLNRWIFIPNYQTYTTSNTFFLPMNGIHLHTFDLLRSTSSLKSRGLSWNDRIEMHLHHIETWDFCENICTMQESFQFPTLLIWIFTDYGNPLFQI